MPTHCTKFEMATGDAEQRAGPDSFRELAAFVESALAPDAEPAATELEQRLDAAQPHLLNLLQRRVR